MIGRRRFYGRRSVTTPLFGTTPAPRLLHIPGPVAEPYDCITASRAATPALDPMVYPAGRKFSPVCTHGSKKLKPVAPPP